ncbi:TPA: hypothetical protein ACS5PF_004041 [Salmonella enterica subsp. enterica]
MKTLIATTILNALSYNKNDNMKSYWAGIYLSVIESLVYQNNLSAGFHKLASMKKNLSFESLKGNTDLNVLNVMLDTTMKNHSFEYLLRNMFNSSHYDLIFNHIIRGVNDIYDINYPTLNKRYYILGQDSVSSHPPIDNYDYLVPASKGFISDKSVIKHLIRHCDAAIELYNPDFNERILLLGEVEGNHGNKLFRESFWIKEKQALTGNRQYHFGLGMVSLEIDPEFLQSISPQEVKKYLVNVGDSPIVVLIFESVTDIPKDMLFAIDDIKKMIHDKKPTPINSFLAGDFFQSLFAIQKLFLDYWSEDVRELIWHLRLIAGGNEGDLSLPTLNSEEPVKYLLSVQKSSEVRGLVMNGNYIVEIQKLEPIDRLILISKALDKSQEDTNLNTEKETIISSVYTGNISPHSSVSIKNWKYK